MESAVWGPMAWRCIHGAAHRYDTATGANDFGTASIFSLFLLRLAWVLPCVYCRESYTDNIREYEIPNASGVRPIDWFFGNRQVRRLAMQLHDFVNRKLGKPLLDNYELVVRRSTVWSAEFTPREFFGLLFLIALNFSSNGEPGKHGNYHRFYSIVPDFCHSLGHEMLGVALDAGLEPLVSRPETMRQDTLVAALYDAYKIWAGDREVLTLDEIYDRYTLCKT